LNAALQQSGVLHNSLCWEYSPDLEFFLRPTVSRPVSLGIGPPFGTLDQILSCSSFIWQLRRSAINASSLTRKRICNLLYNCFWALPEQSHLSRSPFRTHGHILLSPLRLPQPGGPGSRIYIPQEQGSPVIPPGTGFPFCRPYDLRGLRWKYSNPPPHGVLTKLSPAAPLCIALQVTAASVQSHQPASHPSMHLKYILKLSFRPCWICSQCQSHPM
jgi:hypothetical protein